MFSMAYQADLSLRLCGYDSCILHKAHKIMHLAFVSYWRANLKPLIIMRIKQPMSHQDVITDSNSHGLEGPSRPVQDPTALILPLLFGLETQIIKTLFLYWGSYCFFALFFLYGVLYGNSWSLFFLLLAISVRKRRVWSGKSKDNTHANVHDWGIHQHRIFI